MHHVEGCSARKGCGVEGWEGKICSATTLPMDILVRCICKIRFKPMVSMGLRRLALCFGNIKGASVAKYTNSQIYFRERYAVPPHRPFEDSIQGGG